MFILNVCADCGRIPHDAKQILRREKIQVVLDLYHIGLTVKVVNT